MAVDITTDLNKVRNIGIPTGVQLDSIGWRNQQGIDDAANQFHYYRLAADNRILFGG